MIARLWHGWAAPENAEDYRHHFRASVQPHLHNCAGFRGCWLLERRDHGETEFLAITLWDSRATIETFAGPDIDQANVADDARAALARFDTKATHYLVVAATPETG